METLDQQIKALKESRAEKSKGLDALADKAINEKRGLTADEQKSYDSLETEIKGFDSQLTLLVKKQEREMEEAKLKGSYHPGTGDAEDDAAKKTQLAKKYSFKKTLNYAIRKETPKDGLEREMHDEERKIMAESGVTDIAPTDTLVPAQMFAKKNQRDMDATTGTAGPNNQGSYTIQTNVQGIVDVLLPEMAIGRLPIMRLNGLRGNVRFPQGKTLPSAGWNTENGSATEKTPLLDKLDLSPKRLAAKIQLSNQLLIQSEANIQSYANSFLVSASAIEFEKVFLKGGGSNEPTGIIGGTGYNTIYAGGGVSIQPNGAVMVWADWVNLVKATKLANSNNGQAYVTSPTQIGRAQITPRQASGVEGNFIMQSYNGGTNGFPVIGTTNMLDTYPSNSGASANCSAIIFGDFSKSVAASWGGLAIGVDPYTNMAEGMTNLVLSSYVDCGMLIPAAFSVCKDLRA